MQRNKINTVLFLKDIESNIIQEAIIVVKGNINFNEKDRKKKNINKNTILKEAELIVNNKIEENTKSFLEFKLSRIIKKYKALKCINIILVVILIILFLT